MLVMLLLLYLYSYLQTSKSAAEENITATIIITNKYIQIITISTTAIAV